ncbi:MAG: alginate export family protein [Candidatus Omnitrophica bacterium]|nr:alginate export family protein [Candidatus Omnitrophota bacterium]
MWTRRLIVLAFVSVVFIHPVFAAMENMKVSGDITAQGIIRHLSLRKKWSSDDPWPSNDKSLFAFSQTRLRIDTDLTENVTATVRFINERLWGAEDEATSNTDVDLDLAYVEIKECLYQPLTLIVGRQNLRYGNGLIIGDPDTNWTAANAPAVVGDLSLRKSFDAVRAIFDFSPYTIDFIYAKPFEGTTYIDDDVTLFGTNIAYHWSSFKGITEMYFFGSDNSPQAAIEPDENQSKTYTVGGRVQFDPFEQLTLGLEGAYQFGDVVTQMPDDFFSGEYEHLNAFAIQAIADYRFPVKYNPTIGATYTYLSGDDDNFDGNHKGWDYLYEDQTPAEIINILFLYLNSNLEYATVRGSIMPLEDVTIGASFTWACLAQKDLETIAYLMGGPVGDGYGVEGENPHFGNEVDAYAVYDYTEDVHFKLNGAWFMPGSYFSAENRSIAYSLRAGVTVDF